MSGDGNPAPDVRATGDELKRQVREHAEQSVRESQTRPEPDPERSRTRVEQ